MQKILVAGATGIVGREVIKLLREKGYKVKTFSANPERAEALGGIVDEIAIGDATEAKSLGGVFAGVDAVISCLGAPVSFAGADRRSFREVDTIGNRNLIKAATKAGVRRFVYVSIHVQDGYADTAYIKAHEAVIDELRRSGISFGVVRPTGIFPIFNPLLNMARKGLICFAGAGSALTNPVHPIEVAETCVEMLRLGNDVSISVGGPDVLTREEISELAFEAIGKKPRILHIPRAIILFASVLLKPFHPRFSEIFEFAAKVFTSECVAPKRGNRRLADYFAITAKNDADEKSVKNLATENF
jgi:uncharacterized protein YbjT (DUF2867 family)